MNKDIEIKFLNDLTKTRDDYIDQENSMKKCLKISSYIRAISLLLIPVFTFWNFLNGGLVIILTAIISFTESYIFTVLPGYSILNTLLNSSAVP